MNKTRFFVLLYKAFVSSFIYFIYMLNIPRCSSNIFVPIKMRITPPALSAPDLNLVPHRFPSFTPAKPNAKVVAPIRVTARTMFTLSTAKLIPTASASMLVAIAKRSMVFTSKLASSFSSSPASLIILSPIMRRRTKAIQWSKSAMIAMNLAPIKYPMLGIKA